MSTFSNLAEAHAAFLANADYADGSGDLTKAQAFRSACRSLLVLMPQSASKGQSSTSMSVTSIKAELDRVEAWVGDHGGQTAGGSRVVYGNMRDFRD